MRASLFRLNAFALLVLLGFSSNTRADLNETVWDLTGNFTVGSGDYIRMTGDVNGDSFKYQNGYFNHNDSTMDFLGNAQIGLNNWAVFYQNGGNMNVGGYLSIARYGGGGALIVNGGTVNSYKNQIIVGEVGSGSMTMNGGRAFSYQGVTLGANGGSAGTLSLDGGTLEAGAIWKGGGTGNLSFNGGTLKATRDEWNYISGLNSANIGGNGAVIDNNGKGIGINQALTGSGSGSVKFDGSGRTTLRQNNTYTGNTLVRGGTLVVDTGGSIASSSTIISSGATVTGAGSIAALTVETGGAVKITTASTTPTAAWNTGGTINFNDGSKIDVTGLSLSQQPYVLIRGSSVTGTPTLQGATGFTVSNTGDTIRLTPNQPPVILSRFAVGFNEDGTSTAGWTGVGANDTYGPDQPSFSNSVLVATATGSSSLGSTPLMAGTYTVQFAHGLPFANAAPGTLTVSAQAVADGSSTPLGTSEVITLRTDTTWTTDSFTFTIPAGNSAVGKYLKLTFNHSIAGVWHSLDSISVSVSGSSTFSLPELTEDVTGNLLFNGTPFSDGDSSSLTVTLSVDVGTITGNAGTGIAVGGTATARTFTGTLADLNAYFITAGKITYQAPQDFNGSKTLGILVSDGQLTATGSATINVQPSDDAPTLAGVSILSIVQESFANASRLTGSISISGDASISGGECILTPAISYRYGYLFMDKLGAASPTAFSAQFDYRANDGTGADGTSFSYGNRANGFSGNIENGLGNGLAVRLIEWAGSRVEVAYNGSLLYNGSVEVSVPFALMNPDYRTVVIQVDELRRVSVSIGGNPVVSNISLPAAYATADKSEWQFVFAARCGGANNKHSLKNLSIQGVSRGIPTEFTVTEDVLGNLLFPGNPFADMDSTNLTVTLSVADGTITGNAGTGITVGGTATARTFAGTVDALNSYFTTPGTISYLGASNNATARQMTITVADGGSTSSQSVGINFTPVNDAPTLATPTEISYQDTSAADIFTSQTGNLMGADFDSASLTYGISGGTIVGGVATKVGTYGTLVLTTSTGAYTFTPNNAAINALVASASETWGMSVSDGTATASANLVVSITSAVPEGQTILFGSLPSKNYGDAGFSLTASSSSGLTVTYASSDASVATVNGSTVTLVGAGTTQITASQAGNGVYGSAQNVVQALTIAKVGLTIRADDKSRGYGAANPALTGSVVGAVREESFTVTASTVADANSGPGSYSIVPEVTGSTLSNYTVSKINGSLTVTSAPFAGADAFTAAPAPSTSTKYSFAQLLANDRTYLGTTLSITGVAPNAETQGTVSTKGSWVVYVPKVGSKAGDTDSFSYTLSNGTSTTTTGTVTISLVSPDMTIEVALASPATPANAYKATFLVMPGLVFEAYGSDTPGGTYTKIGSTWTSASSGKLEVTDTAAAEKSSRFYKLKWVP